jgi:hypothetical protein
MKRVWEAAGRDFWLHSMGEPEEIQSPFPGPPYACLIWDTGSSFNVEQRLTVATALVASDCKYGVCGGSNCGAWDDSIDLASVLLSLEETGAESDDKSIMTTEHDGEATDEVVDFFLNHTDFDSYEFHHYVVLVVGRDRGQSERLRQAIVRSAGVVQ